MRFRTSDTQRQVAGLAGTTASVIRSHRTTQTRQTKETRQTRQTRSAPRFPHGPRVISRYEKRILSRGTLSRGVGLPVSDELDVLKSVTGLLDGAGIPYMVTGSMAANFYAVPRMTRDIDLVIELSEREVDRVIRLFQHEYYIDRDMVLRAVRDHTMFNMIHNTLVVKVDCVVRKETEYRREEFARRRAVSIAGRQVFIVSPEDLILSKLDWAKESRSQIQLDDVRNLLQSVDGLDTEYLTRWVDRLGLTRLYQEVRQ